MEILPINISWEQQVTLCIMLLQQGSEEGKKAAIDELLRIARYLDTKGKP